jgi:hypothetical protein
MTNNNISFEDEELRGKYARDISWLLGEKNLKWSAYPSSKKPEIFIRPKDSPEENLRVISRVSLQIKDNSISLGISGYNFTAIRDTIETCKSKGYKYHKKEYNKYGKEEDGRWWLTKSLNNIESVINEFRDIEPFLHEKF